MSYVGIDFGTTNSAVALAGAAGAPRLAPFPDGRGGEVPTWRTLLYFEEGGVSAGAPAIRRYLETEGEGRLIQSIKSHLASALFARTQILGRLYSLEELVAAFLNQARAAVGVELGRRAVVGRPVRYWGAETAEDDARAVARMRTALELAGFDDVLFEYEPIAAALRYADTLDHDELVLIADLGGGTSDFSVVRVGPGLVPGDAAAILATGGVGIGGDSFDGRIIDHVVAPALGRDTAYRDEMGAVTPIPVWLYTRLRRWHHLSFLKSHKTMALLERMRTGALAPDRIEALISVIEDDLGLPLHQSVEAVKVALSGADRDALRFDRRALTIHEPVARAELSAWIAPDLDDIDTVIADVLHRADVAPSDIDRVFATGGSSFVPAVRARLAHRFGADRLVGGHELTSVAWGLAARARTL